MGRRIRTIEYEGIHLVCFGCGIYGHRKENCPKKTTETMVEAGLQVAEEGDGGNEIPPEDRREPAVGDCMDDRVQIRKDTVEKSGITGSFGPWMLAKKPERRAYKERVGKRNDKIVQGKDSMKGDGKAKKQDEGKDKGISIRFNVLYGLEDVSEDNSEPAEDDLELNGPVEAHIEVGKGKTVQDDSFEEGEVSGLGRRLAHKESHKRNKAQSSQNINNTENASDMQALHESMNNNKELSSGRKERAVRGISRQAAAEEEHTVVRGKDKGKIITRMVVGNDQGDITMGFEDDDYGGEHHRNPPALEVQGDHMVIEQEMQSVDALVMRGHGPDVGGAGQHHSA